MDQSLTFIYSSWQILVQATNLFNYDVQNATKFIDLTLFIDWSGLKSYCELTPQVMPSKYAGFASPNNFILDWVHSNIEELIMCASNIINYVVAIRLKYGWFVQNFSDYVFLSDYVSGFDHGSLVGTSDVFIEVVLDVNLKRNRKNLELPLVLSI